MLMMDFVEQQRNVCLLDCSVDKIPLGLPVCLSVEVCPLKAWNIVANTEQLLNNDIAALLRVEQVVPPSRLFHRRWSDGMGRTLDPNTDAAVVFAVEVAVRYFAGTCHGQQSYYCKTQM